jgi:hypothetical protein
MITNNLLFAIEDSLDNHKYFIINITNKMNSGGFR